MLVVHSPVTCLFTGENPKKFFEMKEGKKRPNPFTTVIYRLLIISLSRQFLHVNLGSPGSFIVRTGEVFEGLQVLVRQGVGADGTEWCRRAGTGSQEL